MNNEKKANKSLPGLRPRRRKLSCDYRADVEGELVPRICKSDQMKKLFKNLSRRFDQNDVVQVLLIEMVTADYWRLAKSLEFESYSTRGNRDPYQWGLADPGMMRYNNASRRNFHRSLEMLLELDEATRQEVALASQEEIGTPAHDLAAEPIDPSPDEKPTLVESPTAEGEDTMSDFYIPRTDICDLNAGNDPDPIWDELPSVPSSVSDAPALTEQSDDPAPHSAEGNVENSDGTSDAGSTKAA